jgi:hypothetical protein
MRLCIFLQGTARPRNIPSYFDVAPSSGYRQAVTSANAARTSCGENYAGHGNLHL